MAYLKNEKSIVHFVVFCLVANVVLSISSFVLIPPDFSQAFPIYPPNEVMIQQFGGSLSLAAFTVLGIKLADEKKVMPAAGFTMLAISTGVLLISYFDITAIVSLESYVKFYYVSAAGNFLLLPALYLISSNEDFKPWVRFAGLIAIVPMVTATFVFLFGSRDFHLLESISNTGFILFYLTQLSWANNLYSNLKRKSK